MRQVMLAAAHEKGLEFLWLGDCGAVIAQGGGVTIVGETIAKRSAESARARKPNEAGEGEGRAQACQEARTQACRQACRCSRALSSRPADRL